MQWRNRSAGALPRVAAVGVAALLMSLPAWGDTETQAPPSTPSEPAVWAPKELRFVYMGFTAHYSCDGLRDKMRKLLLRLGARNDVQVQSTGCPTPYGTPDPFPAVYIKMHVLQPAAAQPASQDGTAVPAYWKSVLLSGKKDAVKAAGDCELIQQVKENVLPLFTTRAVEFRANCVPHDLSVGNIYLRAEVLMTDQVAPAGEETKPAGAS